METGVGPITEADVNNAQSTGAAILGFDVGCPPKIAAKIEASGIPVHLHKLI